jgi:hypothetical protein
MASSGVRAVQILLLAHYSRTGEAGTSNFLRGAFDASCSPCASDNECTDTENCCQNIAEPQLCFVPLGCTAGACPALEEQGLVFDCPSDFAGPAEGGRCFCPGVASQRFCGDGGSVPTPSPPPTTNPEPSASPTPPQSGPEEPWSPPLTGVSFDFAYAPNIMCEECPAPNGGSACGTCACGPPCTDAVAKINNFACNLFPRGGFSFGHGAFEGMGCGECVFLRCGGRGCSSTNAPPFAHMRVDNAFSGPNALEVSQEFFEANWSPAGGNDSRDYQWAPNPGCSAMPPADLESLVWTTVEPEFQASLP